MLTTYKDKRLSLNLHKSIYRLVALDHLDVTLSATQDGREVSKAVSC